ncbi:alpha-1,6-mannosyl-glycoprotein 2-beta-N-acetylglucosaminyltransferase-like isoform X1 [Belonocnema kinseyi]|uniref:alpha-1,6-mannosyl-glycoprotein 2-beta-N-acetylglucosaminyltransferase-like isoform X1 n=1 Tax=Belonocnema kinseyi TaxID=2817044 RepID=UPI00143DB214|nr:alpha-1,6-mannosyl-glycoprotein 2-beta-N-acetylglucosaminyltransferase-like isoform X1 [Belonocnema kinseyi]XP_033212704.1 alpha-1,6-mannosyl-glycoprotein 2-beta-N-acetylglucosaminyltransferase-like isoform X1 [Belonocnema kinseyi]XP_033212705.1 alpha-1,6-mannosyl-glycoprotein 2-beta-N-acetylglucosaminyltransferase-like isoform X1 [Belonocnema kinseyi]
MKALSIFGTSNTYIGCLTRTLALVLFVTFFWFQIYVINLTIRDWPRKTSINETYFSQIPQEFHRLLKKRHNATATTNATSRSLTDTEISEIRRNIDKINSEQRVYNEETFGPVFPDTTVIVVQVHTRFVYLAHLIASLAQAKDIEQSLLIFSHDFWDPDINYLVQSIDFCRVMQIFYPYSIQTHPRTFPGEDPRDCPRNITQKQALLLKCKNAEHPDLYGHYREAKYTQTKHHWWWKANRVFDQLKVTRNQDGMVLFLEEDHYVAEDFLHVLRLMKRTCEYSCERCNVLTLGTHLTTYDSYSEFNHKVEVTSWITNMGLAFNRETWSKIKKCAKIFCSYDDYNWDYSLQRVARNCLPPRKGSGIVPRSDSGLIAMMMLANRVFHVGECGIHQHKENCESTAVIAKVQNVLKSVQNHLYPTQLTLTFTGTTQELILGKANGGWGDLRDQELCWNITLNPDLILP